LIQSVQFHNSGQKHQDAVKRRLSELTKKGEIDYRNQQQVNTDLKRMEEAALKAYHKDLTSNPDLTARNISSKHTHVAKIIEQAAANPRTYKSGESAALLAASSLKNGPGPSLPLLPPPKVWHEALSPEGYSYYWNVDTQETCWEAPEEGFVSLLDQQLEELKNATETTESQGTSAQPIINKKKKNKKKKQMFADGFDNLHNNYPEEEEPENPSSDVQAAPYGQWETVEPTISAPVNLQLPKINFTNQLARTQAVPEEPRIKFAEKKAGAPVSSFVKPEPGQSEFKKRKIDEDHKKNFRVRDSE